ncbi:unnamed protein product [Caenorhabditis nigoni]
MPISHIYLDDPPAYVEEVTIKNPAVEVVGPSINSGVEPAERQRHFGILKYTVNDRFKKMMILLVILILLIAGIGIALLIVLLHHGGSEGTATTSKVGLDSTSTYTTIITTKIPTTTTTRITTQNLETSSTSPEKTTVASTTSIKTTYFPKTCCAGTFPQTFLFAYSNDLSAKTVSYTWDAFTSYNSYYSWFGSVRFDTENMDMKFYTNIDNTTTTIQNNLPDSNQGFQNSSIGSNVFDAIEKFFSNTEAPACGSIIVVLLKRYPNESDIFQLVTLIRSHHAIVHVITSATPSGGSQPKTMYSVASKTNGMGAFIHDSGFQDAIWMLPIYSYVFPVYATTIQVSGNGTKILPDFYPSKKNSYLIEITCQDHVPIDSFRNFTLRYANPIGSGSLPFGCPENYGSEWNTFQEVSYSMILDYNYLGHEVENLQIRIFTDAPPSNWLPYSD